METSNQARPTLRDIQASPQRVYAYGMTVLSTIHVLDGPYPEKDTYGEIRRTFRFPGGEAANAAILLARWGLGVQLAGPHLGYLTRRPLLEYFAHAGIDVSAMSEDPTFEGLQDLVLVDATTRTVFGTFGSFFADDRKRWERPDPVAVRESDIVLLDPFFAETTREIAELCGAEKKPYVTIDCHPESIEHRGAAATVVSGEYRRASFADAEIEVLFRRYQEASSGLVVFTSGVREILYARRGGSLKRVRPYSVPVKGTLGAGDSFRAGILYGTLRGWDDDTTVRFAAATAALWCAHFPAAADPPALDAVLSLATSISDAP